MTDKKIALITGGNRGLGFETAKQLGEKGIYVVVGARQLKDAQSAAAKLKELEIQSDGLELDVKVRSQHSAAAQYLKDRFGKLDILVNNAGIMLEGEPLLAAQNPSPVLSVRESDLRETMETNFFSTFFLVKELVPLLMIGPEISCLFG